MLSTLILASLIATTAIAANITVSDTFVSSDGSVIFSLNVPTDSNDLYFVLSGPIYSEWLAVGLGNNQMAGALILMAYGSSNGSGVTLSPRLTSGHVEPTYEPSIQVDILPGSGISGDTLTVNGRCSNCRSWGGGSLNVQSSGQNMIFAAGRSSGVICSDSKTADTRRHAIHGIFTMDLTRASGPGGLPVPNTASVSSIEASLKADSDVAPAFHACIMILAFLGFMPFGLIVLRLFGFTRWHGLNQGFAAVLALIGFALGIYCSTMYNRSKHFDSAHQVFGFLIMTALVTQFVLGFMHHRVYKRTKQPTRMAPIHVWLGRIVIPAGVINGFIGFPFALNTHYNYTLCGLTFMVSLPVISILFWKALRKANKPKSDPGVPLESFSPSHHAKNPWGQSQSGASNQPSLGPVNHLSSGEHQQGPVEPWSHV